MYSKTFLKSMFDWIHSTSEHLTESTNKSNNFRKQRVDCSKLSSLGRMPLIWKLEKMAIVMHCNLSCQTLHPSITTPIPTTKSEIDQPICSWLITFLLLIPYLTLWPWPLTLNVASVSAMTWLDSILNFSEIEQSVAELWWLKKENLGAGFYGRWIPIIVHNVHCTHVQNFSKIDQSAAKLWQCKDLKFGADPPTVRFHGIRYR